MRSRGRGSCWPPESGRKEVMPALRRVVDDRVACGNNGAGGACRMMTTRDLVDLGATIAAASALALNISTVLMLRAVSKDLERKEPTGDRQDESK